MPLPRENEFAGSLVSALYLDSDEPESASPTHETPATAFDPGTVWIEPQMLELDMLSAQHASPQQPLSTQFPSPSPSPPQHVTGHGHEQQQEEQEQQLQAQVQQEQEMLSWCPSPSPLRLPSPQLPQLAQPDLSALVPLHMEPASCEWGTATGRIQSQQLLAPAQPQMDQDDLWLTQECPAPAPHDAMQGDVWLAQQELIEAQLACTEAKLCVQEAELDPGMHHLVWTYKDDQMLTQGPFSLSHMKSVSVPCVL